MPLHITLDVFSSSQGNTISNTSEFCREYQESQRSKSLKEKFKLDLGSIRSSLRYGLITPYRFSLWGGGAVGWWSGGVVALAILV